jgi:hypothetical protein
MASRDRRQSGLSLTVIMLASERRLLLRVSDAGQRHRRDIHQWPASESRQGKNPREMAGGGAASTERYGGLRTTELGEGKRGR